MSQFRGERALVIGVLVAGLGGVMLSCASESGPQQAARPVKTSFLGDYDQLQAGGEGQALLRYRDPAADFSRYDKIALDPVIVWAKQQSRLAELPVEDVQALVDQADASLRKSLSRDYTLVDRAGPGVLRIRVAITEADGAPALMGTVSSRGPGAQLLAGASKLTTGTAAFVDSAGAEVEILDSMTNQRLAAAIDRQLVRTKAESWDDIYQIYELWSEKLAQRLRELRAEGAGAR